MSYTIVWAKALKSDEESVLYQGTTDELPVVGQCVTLPAKDGIGCLEPLYIVRLVVRHVYTNSASSTYTAHVDIANYREIITKARPYKRTKG